LIESPGGVGGKQFRGGGNGLGGIFGGHDWADVLNSLDCSTEGGRPM
jgi:hypothetical protein